MVLEAPQLIKRGWAGARGRPGTRVDSRLVERVGRMALHDAAPWLDRLHGEADMSLLARRPSLQSWADAFDDWDLWVLALIDGREPRAVAPLARRRTWWGFDVVVIGEARMGDSPVAVRDDAAGAELATGLAAELSSLNRPWTIRVPQLPAGSVLAADLAARLPASSVSPCSSQPLLRFDDDRPPRRWLTRNTTAALAKARNRVGREGHHLEVGWVAPWDRIVEVLPEVVAVHRARDFDLRGATLLDDAREAAFYHQTIERNAENWRLLAVRIDGSLAGYAMCLMDGATLRVWDNRVSPTWRRYSAGLIANAELVLRAAQDDSVTALDWGPGVQRYKSSLSTEMVETETFVAWSSTPLRAGFAAGRRIGRPV